MKKLISLCLSVILICVFSLNIYADASNNNEWLPEPEYLFYNVDEDGNVSYEKIIYIQLPNSTISENGVSDNSIINQDIIVPYGNEYPYGTVRIVDGRGTETARYAEIDKRYATILPNYYNALTAAGLVITSTAGSFVIAAAGTLGVALDSIIGTTVEIAGYVHRDRVYRIAQVYTPNGWKDYYTCVNREWYSHIIIPNNTNPSLDIVLHCTYQNGFSPYYREMAPHFNDYSYMTNRATELYYLNQSPITEYGF